MVSVGGGEVAGGRHILPDSADFAVVGLQREHPFLLLRQRGVAESSPVAGGAPTEFLARRRLLLVNRHRFRVDRARLHALLLLHLLWLYSLIEDRAIRYDGGGGC